MTPYSDSLWSQAPSGATHWGRLTEKSEPIWIRLNATYPPAYNVWNGPNWGGIMFECDQHISDFKEIHERPLAYQSPAQLIEAYKREHGAEIEQAVEYFLEDVGSFRKPRYYELEDLLDDAAFCQRLIERHLAAERARIEGQS